MKINWEIIQLDLLFLLAEHNYATFGLCYHNARLSVTFVNPILGWGGVVRDIFAPYCSLAPSGHFHTKNHEIVQGVWRGSPPPGTLNRKGQVKTGESESFGGDISITEPPMATIVNRYY